MSERTHISYSDLSDLMKGALSAQLKRNENNDSVQLENVYFGGGAMCRLQLVKMLPSSPATWVIFECFSESGDTRDATVDDSTIYESGSPNLAKTAREYMSEASSVSELTDDIEIEAEDINRLKDIISGQQSLFGESHKRLPRSPLFESILDPK